MNCHQFGKVLEAVQPPGWESFAASPETSQHLSSCVQCADRAKRQRLLTAGLSQLASQQSGFAASARLEAALLNEFRSRTRLPLVSAIPPSRPSATFAWLPVRLLSGGALAAALAALLLVHHPPGSRVLPGSSRAPASAVEESAENDSGFIPLPYFGTAGLVSASDADADVVRVEMPRATLAAMGVPVADDGTAGAVEAELLLGAGGMPQAVRVLE